MPTINKLPQKQKSTYHSDTEMRKLRQKAYSTTKWRKTRLEHLRQFPLCAECLKKGVVKAAEHVHHKISPFKNNNVNYDLLYDPDNLESICSECHGLEHQKDKGFKTPEEIIKELDDLFDNNVKDEEIE